MRSTPVLLEQPRERHRVLERPAPLGPVRDGEAHEERAGPRATDRAPPASPRARAACGCRTCRRTGPCAGCSGARGTRAAGSRARRATQSPEARGLARAGRPPRTGAPRAACPPRRAPGARWSPCRRPRRWGPRASSRRASWAGIGAPPSQGRCVEAFRPACASCMPATAPCAWMKRTMRSSGAMCSSFQMPRSCGRDAAAVLHGASPPSSPAPRRPRRGCPGGRSASRWRSRPRSSTGTWARRRCGCLRVTPRSFRGVKSRLLMRSPGKSVPD